MTSMSRGFGRSLGHLYAILEAGERGYAVAAANVNNRGLKMMFKTYARQRADFRRELRAPAENHARSRPLIDLVAMIHRGRIDIFAALTIGDQNREKAVVKEVLAGEQAALRAYNRALRSRLPENIRPLVEWQYQQVQRVVGEVRLLRGEGEKQLVVRLFDSQHDADRAMKRLWQANFDPAAMQKVDVEKGALPYEEGTGGRLVETAVSGAAGGALWGSVSGALAGFGVLHLPGLGLQQASLAVQELAWAETALGAIFSGGFVGAVLGMFIGWGVQGGDAYLYTESQRGQVLLRLETQPGRAAEAAQIMAQINREARGQRRHALA